MTNIYEFAENPVLKEILDRYEKAQTPEELEAKVRRLQESCVGASRAGANGAHAKLEYALEPARRGTTVIIGHGRHRISDLTEGRVPCTRIGLE